MTAERAIDVPGEGAAETAAPRATPAHNPITAGGWSGVSFIIGNAIGGLVYIPLARLLSPGDFGLYAEANLIFLAMVMLAEGNVGQALIQLRGDEHALARAALWMAAVFGLLGTALCAAAAWPLARFFDDPELTGLLLLMAPGVLLSALGAVPHALLQRDLDFRRKTLPETAAVAVGGLGALAAALAGLGVYSFAAQTVLAPAVSTALAWWVWRGSLGGWRAEGAGIRQLTRLWAAISAGDLAIYARLNTDYTFTGRLLGKDALGVYSVAWSTSAGPLLFITAFTARVGYAVFARLQDQRERLRDVFLAAERVIATAAIPLFLAAIVVTPDLVNVTLGAKWQAAASPVAALFVLQMVRAICGPGASLVLATGHSRLYATVGVAMLPLTVIAVLIGTRAGVPGVSAAMVVAVGGASAVYLALALALLDAGVMTWLRGLRAAAVICAIGLPPMIGVRLLLTAAIDAPDALRLIACLATGLASLAISIRIVRPGIAADVALLRAAGE